MNVQFPIGGTGPDSSRLSPLLLLAEQKKMIVQLPIGGTGPVSSRLSTLLWLAQAPIGETSPPPDDSRVVFQGRADKETPLHLACRSGNMDLIRLVFVI